MKTQSKRIRRRVGDIVKIPLAENSYCFGRVLQEPLMAFYDLLVSTVPDIGRISSSPILFKVWVMNKAITSGRWPVIGNADLDKEITSVPEFFKQDPVSKAFSKYSDGKEKPATQSDCIGLERAAVWEAEHIEDRLRDYYAGRKNKWVESLKPV